MGVLDNCLDHSQIRAFLRIKKEPAPRIARNESLSDSYPVWEITDYFAIALAACSPATRPKTTLWL